MVNPLAPTRLKKILFFVVSDAVLLSFCLLASFYLRFEFRFPETHLPALLVWLPAIVLLKLLLLALLGLYQLTWSFVGIRELTNVIKALILGLLILFVANLYVRHLSPAFSLPRSVLIIDFFLGVIAVSSLRISKRIYREVLTERRQGKPALIIGAGPTGERLAREFLRPGDSPYIPAYFVDDDLSKKGNRIHGVPVLGEINDIPGLLEAQPVQAALIAITTLNHLQIKRIFNMLVEAGVKEIKVVPHISHLPERAVTVKDIQDIHIEDLLYREPVTIDETAIRHFLSGKTVLVTGAAGSIGSEIVRQAQKYYPRRIIILDIDETEIFNLTHELKRRAQVETEIVPFVGDIRDQGMLSKLFTATHPQVVFHAAAYKHVPMMESFPDEAAKTNILGTWQLASAAADSGIERFVNISTDKAVNPTSIMGATKRVAEMICTSLSRAEGTLFISVRFGNVLGSRGSVVPLFLEQIKNGGPVTVTHPEVKRYFMTIPEAVTLVFQAATMGQGGEVFVLDMGELIPVVQLAEDLIRLNHLEPHKDIKIEFTGLRPGEKLFEELLTAEEGTSATTHQKIFIARNHSAFESAEIERILEKVRRAASVGPDAVKEILKAIVPFYKVP